MELSKLYIICILFLFSCQLSMCFAVTSTRARVSRSTTELQSESQDSSVNASKLHLSSYLWESSKSKQLRTTAYYNSTFVHGIVTGTLDPDYYGSYYVQDAWWVWSVGKIWGEVAAASGSNRAPLKAFAEKQEKSWTKYADDMFQKFSIPTQTRYANAIVGEAAQRYIDYIRDSVKEDPAYALITTYPCAKLWEFWQTTCFKTSRAQGNVYYKNWCVQVDPPVDQESLIQRYFADGVLKNKDKLLSLFVEGLGHEISFFNGAAPIVN